MLSNDESGLGNARKITCKVSPKGERAPGVEFHRACGGSAWLMTRFTVGNARRNARSISSTFW
jgi:hypothetical protein